MRGTTGHSFSSLSLDLRMSSVNSEIQEMDRDNETHPFIEQNKDGKRFVVDVETPPKTYTTWSSTRGVIVSLLLVMQNNTMSTSLYVASRFRNASFVFWFTSRSLLRLLSLSSQSFAA